MRCVATALRAFAVLATAAACACAPIEPPAASPPEAATTGDRPLLPAGAASGSELAMASPAASRPAAAAPDRAPRLTPAHVRPGARQTGRAHWYGRAFAGRRTASGERLNRRAMTAAHPFLPLGTMVRVTNLENGKSVTVRINDRLSGRTGAIVDLTRAAAEKIDAVGDPPQVALLVLTVPAG